MVRQATRAVLTLAATVSTVAALTAGLPGAAAPAAATTKTTYAITNLGLLGGAIEFQPAEPSAINANGQMTGFSYTSTVVTETCGH